MKKTFDVKRLTMLALLTTIALTIFVVESAIPTLVPIPGVKLGPVSYTHLRAHETDSYLVCRLLLEKKKEKKKKKENHQ